MATCLQSGFTEARLRGQRKSKSIGWLMINLPCSALRLDCRYAMHIMHKCTPKMS